MKTALRPFTLLLVCLAGLTSGTARADTLFVNATDATAGGFNAFANDGVYVAQDFFLGGESTLTAFTFNAYTDGTTVPVTEVNLAIYADLAGMVGAELLRGTFSLVGAPVFTESLYGFDLYDFTVALPSWKLAGGNYWLGVNAGPLQSALHWSVPGDNLGQGLTGSPYPGWIGDGVGDPASYVNGYDWEHVFRFEGTTVPVVPGVPDHGATVLLLGLGLAVLILARRHRPNSFAAPETR
ncbi:MAG TPA: VPDSG-CTERM sorting domain-containing protein [Lacunisphaera sp.]|nr:VPDSG-CTERM sorting domain-containing protein [Lacunisphaera sp.]